MGPQVQLPQALAARLSTRPAVHASDLARAAVWARGALRVLSHSPAHPLLHPSKVRDRLKPATFPIPHPFKMSSSRQERSQERSQKRDKKRRLEVSPLEEFFAKYSPEFEYDPKASASLEFYRLCDHFGWDKEDKKRREAYQDFKDALVKQFNRIYGIDEDNLADWQNLCYMVHVEPIPDDLNRCRQAVRATYVNLVDLIDRDTTGEDVKVFDTELALSNYTKSTGKFFPKENAYAGGLLRFLLRRIMNPARDAPRRRDRTKRRR